MPGQQIQKGTTYVNYPTVGTNQVTAENLNDHVDNAILLPGAISAQLEGAPEDNDYVLAERGGSLFKYALSSIKDLFAAYFLLRSGSTMTGELTLSSSTPSAAAVAASKGYVDATVSATIIPGTIVMWGASTVPTGWLECNGQSTAGSPNLIPLFGTNVPDLRGEFIRGWSNGRSGVDPGRQIRSFQGQDIQPHTHGYTLTNTISWSQEGGSALGTKPVQEASQTGVAGSTETRPRNVALMFIVKT
jgi:microcystin-dependent protein